MRYFQIPLDSRWHWQESNHFCLSQEEGFAEEDTTEQRLTSPGQELWPEADMGPLEYLLFKPPTSCMLPISLSSRLFQSWSFFLCSFFSCSFVSLQRFESTLIMHTISKINNCMPFPKCWPVSSHSQMYVILQKSKMDSNCANIHKLCFYPF